MSFYLYTLAADRVLRKVCDKAGVHLCFSNEQLANDRAAYESVNNPNAGMGVTVDTQPNLDCTRDGLKLTNDSADAALEKFLEQHFGRRWRDGRADRVALLAKNWIAQVIANHGSLTVFTLVGVTVDDVSIFADDPMAGGIAAVAAGAFDIDEEGRCRGEVAATRRGPAVQAPRNVGIAKSNLRETSPVSFGYAMYITAASGLDAERRIAVRDYAQARFNEFVADLTDDLDRRFNR